MALQHIAPYIRQVIKERYDAQITAGRLAVLDPAYLKSPSNTQNLKRVEVSLDGATVQGVNNALIPILTAEMTVLVSEVASTTTDVKTDLLEFGAAMMGLFARNDALSVTTEPVDGVTRDDLRGLMVMMQDARLNIPLLDPSVKPNEVRLMLDLPVRIEVGGSVWDPDSPDFDPRYTGPVLRVPLRNLYLRLETGDADETVQVYP